VIGRLDTHNSHLSALFKNLETLDLEGTEKNDSIFGGYQSEDSIIAWLGEF
jgi:hypothetical protein